MLDYEIYGLDPGGHHLTSLIFHILNTLLLFAILFQMTGRSYAAGFAAALFALHPLHVESVAWVSERKDVLSAFFGLLTIRAYIRYVLKPALSRYLMVMIFFALGLMSKPMLVTLPFLLLLLIPGLNRFGHSEILPLQSKNKNSPNSPQKATSASPPLKTSPPTDPSVRTTVPNSPSRGTVLTSPLRPTPPTPPLRGESKGRCPGAWRSVRGAILEKVPLILLVILSSIITLYAQEHGGAIRTLEFSPLHFRIANALTAYLLYLVKMVYPVNLAFLYPYPDHLRPGKSLDRPFCWE